MDGSYNDGDKCMTAGKEIYRQLCERRESMREFSLRDAFEQDEKRFDDYHLTLGPLLFDFSRHLLDQPTLGLLSSLATASGLPQALKELREGDLLNFTENRAALHLALRDQSGLVVDVSRRNESQQALETMLAFTERLRAGEVRGVRGETISAVVNLGVGGSDLGGVMAVEALQHVLDNRLSVHFISSVDGVALHRLLATLNPAQTLFVFSSKSFTTVDTQENAAQVQEWYRRAGYSDADLMRHFAGVSSVPSRMTAYGIPEDQQFFMGDYIGGRFSLSSCIGFPIACAIGREHFLQFLQGMHTVDRHFCDESPERNIPVLMALLEWWYASCWDSQALAVLPYHQSLHRFPSYLTQLQMESLGKSVNRSGEPVPVPTGHVVFGEVGINAQHSFLQLLHQGNRFIPADFIAFARMPETTARQQDVTLANCLAQSRVLAFGYTAQEVVADMRARGETENEIARLLPHRVHQGNRPSSTLMFESLTPYTLGMLVALYEHKTFVLATLWGINAFDQMGVELGKRIAGELVPSVRGSERRHYDASTDGILDFIHHSREAGGQ